MENVKKRVNDMTRTHQKHKKLLIEFASLCKLIKYMFIKHKNV